MPTYSTSDIAYFLNTQRQNINVYIKKGYLNAIMVDGNWEITHQDYLSFRKEYYDTDKRNSSRGVQKKLTHEQVSLFAFMISDLQNDDISLKDFTTTYKDKTDLIPSIQDFIIYKRDMCIKKDKSTKDYKYQDLANMYGLSKGSIKNIVNQDKVSEF